jgi:hypothetical protein
MPSEPCLICSGRCVREDGACAYCAGTGRVAVKNAGEKTVWQATGSCKVPAKKLILKESKHDALKA